MSPQILRWSFPLPRVHLGPILGNGLMGIMAWGGPALRLTIGRAGFWDRRGGRDAGVRVSFAQMRRYLEGGDEAGLRRAMGEGAAVGAYRRPTQLGGARLELGGTGICEPLDAELDLRRAVLTLKTSAGVWRLRMAAEEEIAWIEGPAELFRRMPVVLHPVWDFLSTPMAQDGCPPPERWGDEEGGGFVQRLPEDEPVALAWERRAPGMLVFCTALGTDAAEQARRRLRAADPETLGRQADQWWSDYWGDVPRVEVPDPDLAEAWSYGLYRQAGLTPPHAPPATLQGAWMEDDRFPPWSNDYHFNINVQLIYEPALATNRAAHFDPLWRMLLEWIPQLRANARTFFGTEDALLLPHAVDDRGHVVGHFWRGTLDQACVAWMALLAWRHYRHTLDETVLREVAWPLLTGAFNGFFAMMERIGSVRGPRWSLPISVSAEYPGWGRDASFQLAAVHALTQTLPQAAARLGKPLDSRWDSVERELPPYTTIPANAADSKRRIALWEGQDLEESHRHHSHLAAITPFRTLDPFDPAHREVVAQSLLHWVRKGAGQWSGWCLPWASTICARGDMADAAVAWLRWWREVYVNAGRAPLHNADFAGCAALANVPPLHPRSMDKDGEIMQCDAAMGALSALMEILVQRRGAVVYVVPSLPQRWRDFEFDGLRVEGGLRVGATVAGGRVREIRLLSSAGGPVHLAWARGAVSADSAIPARECMLAPEVPLHVNVS